MDFWGFMGFLWTATADFMSTEIPEIGISPLEFLIGSAVIGLIMWAVWRILE